VAVARYHLPLVVWDHGLFAGEMPYFLHQTAISALFNELKRAPRLYRVLAEKTQRLCKKHRKQTRKRVTNRHAGGCDGWYWPSA
jgi:hypothetical protein